MDKLVRCKKCGAEIFKGAKICPQCGAKNKKPFWSVILIIIILLVAFFMIKNKMKNKVADNDYKKTLSAINSVADKIGSSNSDSSSEKISSTDANKKDTSKKKSEKKDSSDKENTSFKEWVDTYEQFMNEYYDFLDDYKKDPTRLMTKYWDYMTKYGELLDASNNLDESDYSLEDWAYYMAALDRILKRASK